MAGEDPEVERFVATCVDYDRSIDQEVRAAKRRHLEVIQEKVAELKKLHRQADAKLDELVKLAAIEIIWPEAFACGELKMASWVGDPRLHFIIKRSDDVERRVQAKNIPEELHKILNYPRNRRDLLHCDGRI